MIRNQSLESGGERKKVNWRALGHKRRVMTLGGGGWVGGDYFVSHHSNCGFYFRDNGKPLKDFMQGR